LVLDLPEFRVVSFDPGQGGVPSGVQVDWYTVILLIVWLISAAPSASFLTLDIASLTPAARRVFSWSSASRSLVRLACRWFRSFAAVASAWSAASNSAVALVSSFWRFARSVGGVLLQRCACRCAANFDDRVLAASSLT
jgi:hypothetical protein